MPETLSAARPPARHRRRLRDVKALVWLYQPFKYLVYAPVLGITSALTAPAAYVMSLLGGERACRWVGVVWARINAFFTPMTVRVAGREHVDPRQSYVIIANHQSHFDIFAVYGWLGMDFRWVMKKELRKVPSMGKCCELMGHVFVDRANREAALAAVVAAKERITGGTSILFFPEGTRHGGEGLAPFKKGAFRMALDLGLPILPVALTGTDDVLPRGTTDLFPGRARLTIGAPIDTSAYDRERLDELMTHGRQRLEALLADDA